MGYRKIIEKTRMEGMKEEASEAMKTSFRKKKKKRQFRQVLIPKIH